MEFFGFICQKMYNIILVLITCLIEYLFLFIFKEERTLTKIIKGLKIGIEFLLKILIIFNAKFPSCIKKDEIILEKGREFVQAIHDFAIYAQYLKEHSNGDPQKAELLRQLRGDYNILAKIFGSDKEKEIN